MDHLLHLDKEPASNSICAPVYPAEIAGLGHRSRCDIGSTGAIAVLTSAGELLGIVDMPTLNDGPRGRRAVNPPLLAAIIFKTHASKAFVEFVGARPGEGAVGPLLSAALVGS